MRPIERPTTTCSALNWIVQKAEMTQEEDETSGYFHGQFGPATLNYRMANALNDYMKEHNAETAGYGKKTTGYRWREGEWSFYVSQGHYYSNQHRFEVSFEKEYLKEC